MLSGNDSAWRASARLTAFLLWLPAAALAQDGHLGSAKLQRFAEAGWASLEARDFDAALQHFEAALTEAGPGVDPARLRAGRARALAGLGDTDRALAIIEPLSAAGPDYMLEHAAVLLMAERPEPALALVNRAEERAKEAAAGTSRGAPSRELIRRANFLRGEALYLLGGYAEAERAFARGLDNGGGAAEWRGIGDSRFAQGKRAEAEDAYNEALELRRYDAMAIRRRARLKYLRGDYDGALDDYAEAEVALDEDPRLLAEHAEALMAAGASADAVAILKRLLNRTKDGTPEHRRTLFHLASALIEAGRPREAEAVMARIGRWPEAAVPLGFLDGRARFARGDAEGALRAYTGALRERPGEPSILFNRGLAWLALDQEEKALGDLAEASVRDPDNQAIRDAIGRIKLKQGKFDEGLAFYEAAVAAHPNGAEPLTQRASAFLAVGEPDRALVDAQKALSIEPGHLPAAEAAARALLALNRPGEAIPYADRLIRSRTMRREGYLLRARAAISGGEPDEALASIEQARNFGAPEWRIALLQGDAYMRLGDYERAKRAYGRTIRLNSALPSVLARRGDAHFQLNEYDLAANDYAAVLSRVRDDRAIRMKRGDALRSIDRNAEAIEEYNTILAADPGNDAAMKARGRARIAMGEYFGGLGDMARSIF